MPANLIDELDPEMAAHVRLLQGGAVPLATSTIEEIRAGARALRARWPRGPAMHSVEDSSFEGQRFRLYRPTAAARLPAVIFFHGGGWTLMDIDTHDAIARGLAEASGAALLSLDYPLAPEAPFPAAIDACQRFTEFVAEAAVAFGLVPGAFGLAGDSAGANLAVAVALRLRDAKRARPRGLCLLYGAYDSDLERPSYQRYGTGELPFSRARMEFFLHSYVPEPAQQRDPLFASLHADLAGLPPSLLLVGSHDALFDENVAMAERLRAAGNAAQLKIYPGAIHGFIEAARTVGAKLARQALADCGAFLAETLGNPEAG